MNVVNNVITIDGGARTGKATQATIISKLFGFELLQSGLFYRGLTFLCLRDGINVEKPNEVGDIVTTYAHRLNLTKGILMLDNIPFEISDLRDQSVTKHVSKVSAYDFLREAILPKQREQAVGVTGLVAEGRDMGTTVFPDAQCKIFLSVSIITSARREMALRKEKGENVSLFTILKEIQKRNQEDSQRHASPLVPAKDAFHIDLSDLTIEEVTRMIVLCCSRKGITPPVPV
jgi:cytidylate kinase